LATWDVFHTDRLEVERGLDDQGVRAAVARGDLTEDDLIRPAGSASPWGRLDDHPDLLAPPAPPPAPPPPMPPPSTPPEATEWDTEADRRFEWADPDDREPDGPAAGDEAEHDVRALEALDEPDYEQADAEASSESLIALVEDNDPGPGPGPVEAAPAAPRGAAGPILPPLEASAAIPVPGSAPMPWNEEEIEVEFDGEDEYDPLEEDEAVAEFTLARGAAETVEELDLAAMVDVAFQLVLFFLVTATTILYKSLEVPKPNNDAPPEAAAQGRSKSLDDLKADFILVEIDPSGTLKIDRQPVPGDLTMTGLAAKLRSLRDDTGRKSMLLSADFATPHRLAVLAYDAANEIGLGIAIARPAPPAGAAGAPPPAAKKG